VKWDTDLVLSAQSDQTASGKHFPGAQSVSGLVPAEILPKLARTHSGSSFPAPNSVVSVDGSKPFVCVLEPKQVIDFVQLASLVIRVGISDNSGSKTSKPLLNEHGE